MKVYLLSIQNGAVYSVAPNLPFQKCYVPLSELQIKKEKKICRNPSLENESETVTNTEMLYRAMLPQLPEYMKALLKILITAAPLSKGNTDSFNVVAKAFSQIP